MKHKTWADVLRMRRELLDEANPDEETDATQMDHQRRDNIVHTAFLCAASFACGLVTSQRGPSILDLGEVSDLDLQQAWSLFALGSGGHLAGCLITGVAFARFRTSVFLFWSLMGLGATTAALPFCGRYAVTAAVYFFSLACVGCVETGTYVDVAKRWVSQGGRIVQLLQLSFVMGGVLSPALTQFFLIPRTHVHGFANSTRIANNSNDTSTQASVWSDSVTANVAYRASLSESNSISNSNSSHDGQFLSHSEEMGASQISYAYGITAAVSFAVAITFVVALVLRRHQPSTEEEDSSRGVKPAKHEQLVPVSSSLVLLLVTATFFFAVAAVEESLQQFLFTFLVHEARWSAPMSALVTSWFWCGVALVRVAAFLLPDRVPPEVVLVLSCAGLPCALAGLHISVAFSSSDGVWACVFFAGMSASLLFPVSFAWLHSCGLGLRSGAVSAAVMLSSALAGVFNPLLLSYLFQRGGASGTGFSYTLMAEACLGLLAFVALYVLSRNVSVSRSRLSATGKLEEEIEWDHSGEVIEDVDGDERDSR